MEVFPTEDSTRISDPKARRVLTGFASTLALFALWQILALLIGKSIIFPAPAEVFSTAFTLYGTQGFWSAVFATFARVMAAFGLCVFAGMATGFAAGFAPMVEAALAPVLTLIRATPVLAVILLALLWFPSGIVPIFSAFLMAYPVMHTSTLSGVRNSDPRLIEMARLFRVDRGALFYRLRLPAAAPHILSGAKSALGLSWKVVVAGEVLSQPYRALGTGMQQSRVYLETGGVFAWAAAAVILCGICEWLLGFAARKAGAHAV